MMFKLTIFAGYSIERDATLWAKWMWIGRPGPLDFNGFFAGGV